MRRGICWHGHGMLAISDEKIFRHSAPATTQFSHSCATEGREAARPERRAQARHKIYLMVRTEYVRISGPFSKRNTCTGPEERGFLPTTSAGTIRNEKRACFVIQIALGGAREVVRYQRISQWQIVLREKAFEMPGHVQSGAANDTTGQPQMPSYRSRSFCGEADQCGSDQSALPNRSLLRALFKPSAGEGEEAAWPCLFRG